MKQLKSRYRNSKALSLIPLITYAGLLFLAVHRIGIMQAAMIELAVTGVVRQSVVSTAVPSGNGNASETVACRPSRRVTNL